MSDFRQQVRDHYDAQSLSPEKVAMILQRARDEASGNGGKVTEMAKQKSWGGILSAIAAVLLLSVAGIWWFQRDVGPVSYTLLAPRVIEFFGNEPDLVPASQDKNEVKAWLLSKGAPANFEFPPSLLPLESAACQVVDVKGEKAYMSCYWTDDKPDRGIHELVHLLVARAEDFHDQPKSEKPVIRELDGWSFASWTKDQILYTLATAAPPEKLSPLISAVEKGESTSMLSAILFE